MAAPVSQVVKTTDSLRYDAEQKRQAAAARASEQSSAYNAAARAYAADVAQRQAAQTGLLLDPGSLRVGATYAQERPDLQHLIDATGWNKERAAEILYGLNGTGVDNRNWSAILGSSDVADAAQQATVDQYGGFNVVNDAKSGGVGVDQLVARNDGTVLRSSVANDGPNAFQDYLDQKYLLSNYAPSGGGQTFESQTPEQYQAAYGNRPVSQLNDRNVEAAKSAAWSGNNPLYSAQQSAAMSAGRSQDLAGTAAATSRSAEALSGMAPAGFNWSPVQAGQDAFPGAPTFTGAAGTFQPAGLPAAPQAAPTPAFGSLGGLGGLDWLNWGKSNQQPNSPQTSSPFGAAPNSNPSLAFGQPQSGMRGSAWGGPWGAGNQWRVSP